LIKKTKRALKNLPQKKHKGKEKEEKEEEKKDDEATTSASTSDTSDDPSTKYKPPKTEQGKWAEVGVESSLFYYEHPGLKSSTKIAGFDMDETLITTKSGAKFPKNKSDWQWWNPSVPKKLKEIYADGYKVVIMSNQNGIGKGKVDASAIEGKIIDIAKELGFPIQALLATKDDMYRKPGIRMWEYLLAYGNDDTKIEISKCYYVGDAAGRPKNWAPEKPKDFSCSDRKFALNAGITFHTPESFFLAQKEYPTWDWDGIDPKVALASLKGLELFTPSTPPLTAKEQEAILMVGPPGSGKSTFCKKYLVPHGYEWVNQDTLKKKEKCAKVAREAIQAGKSVVIDNNNYDPSTRAYFIKEIESAKKIPIRCFHMQTPLELAEHMNLYREKKTNQPHIPDIAYNMYKSRYEKPALDEGYTEIKKINFVPDFANEADLAMFYQRT